MPKLTEREHLADLEARQTKIAGQIVSARRAVRDKYASLMGELAVECLTEREFRDILSQAIRAGGPASVTALKALPSPPG